MHVYNIQYTQCASIYIFDSDDMYIKNKKTVLCCAYQRGVVGTRLSFVNNSEMFAFKGVVFWAEVTVHFV